MHLPHPTVLDAILACVQHAPSRVAIRSADGHLTYRQLADRASMLATLLLRQDVPSGSVVAAMLVRSSDWVVAMMACWMTRLVFLPIDPSQPRQRVLHQLSKSGAACLIGRHALLEHFDVPAAVVPVACDGVATTESEQATVARQSPEPTEVAYVVFTSGSSGVPKGVVVDHAALRYAIAQRVAQYGPAADARVLIGYSVSFDSSLAGLLYALSSGGEAVLLAPEAERDLHQVANAIHREQVTHLDVLPSVLGSLLDLASDAQLSSVRSVVVGGEELPSSVAARCRQRLPAVPLFNEYGPTEATIWSTVEHVQEVMADERVPIGHPLPGTVVRVVGESGELVPPGSVGELWLSGPGLARGYVGEEAQTAERFVSADDRRWYRTGDLAMMLPDGRLRWLGRIDHQVKLNGFRIELEEVEHVLRGVPGVTDAAAAVFGDAGHRRLVGFVVPAPGFTVTSTHVRRSASERLAPHMVPTMIVPLTALPRTPNGKLDRAELADPSAPLPASQAPALPDGEEERWLASTWSTLLGRPHVGRDHNFFELGGTSILAMRLMAQLHRDLGVRVDSRELFYRSLAQFAADIRAARRATAADIVR